MSNSVCCCFMEEGFELKLDFDWTLEEVKCITLSALSQVITKQSFCVLGTLCKIVSHDEQREKSDV